jgi:peptidoglycan/xylan/chitin deacetylase (PgdA/CDA1 family)
VTLRGARAESTPRALPTRFSGSTVVQNLPSLLPSPKLDDEISVVVVRDEAAVSYYDKPAKFDAIVASWREALTAVGARVRVLSSTEARDDRAARVLVVPSSPCLMVATREAIENAGARGVGVILTGSAGTFDAGCRPLGYGLIVGATGASRVAELERREMTYITLPAESPLAADIPAGARLDLHPGRQIALRHPTRDAFYSDYALQPQPANKETLLDAALTHASIEGRRVVYWGFELSDVVRRPWNRSIVRLLVRNSVAWAAAHPLAAVESWPNGKRAAASIAQDVEAGFANARFAADSLRAAGVRSSFYLTSRLAQRYERLTRYLAASGEIGTHGDNHSLLGGLPSDEQRARLLATQRELHALVGSDANGLRPPEEQFDTVTMSAWLAAKGNYMFGANDSRSAAPELLRVGRDTLVLVGRVGSDDFAATARFNPPAATLAQIFLGEYERVRALGGHYVLSYHSQVLAKPELVPALATVARKLASDTAVWVATVGDVATWWRARARIETSVRITGDRMRIVAHNTGNRRVENAVIRIALPDAKQVLRSDAHLLPSNARTLRIAVPPLGPRASKTISVTLSDTF